MRWYAICCPRCRKSSAGGSASSPSRPHRRSPNTCGAARSCVIVWCYTGPHAKPTTFLPPSAPSARRCSSACRKCRSRCCRVHSTDCIQPVCSGTGGPTFSTRSPTGPSTCISSTAHELPTGHSTMHLYPIDGAAARVADDATPFAYRDGGWAGVIVGVDPDPANAGLITDWAKHYWEELHPTSAGGAYINFMMDEGQDRVRASYLGNYERLAASEGPLRPCRTCSTSIRTSFRLIRKPYEGRSTSGFIRRCSTPHTNQPAAPNRITPAGAPPCLHSTWSLRTPLVAPPLPSSSLFLGVTGVRHEVHWTDEPLRPDPGQAACHRQQWGRVVVPGGRRRDSAETLLSAEPPLPVPGPGTPDLAVPAHRGRPGVRADHLSPGPLGTGRQVIGCLHQERPLHIGGTFPVLLQANPHRKLSCSRIEPGGRASSHYKLQVPSVGS